MVVVDTNVLIELFLPSNKAEAVQDWWIAEPDWRLPALWICEFRHIHLKYLRAGLIELPKALIHLTDAALQLAHQYGCSSYDAEFVVLAQQLACPLLTFDGKLLQLFPDVAIQPGS